MSGNRADRAGFCPSLGGIQSTPTIYLKRLAASLGEKSHGGFRDIQLNTLTWVGTQLKFGAFDPDYTFTGFYIEDR